MSATNPGLEALRSFSAEDYEHFAQFDNVVDETLKDASRALPADFYDNLRTGILRSLVAVAGGTRLRVRLVVDTNILLMDAFRVARGVPSTTGRLLESRFVELVAPSEIRAEARSHVVRDLPKGASLKAAQVHLEMLLSRLVILEGLSAEAYRRAAAQMTRRDPKDTPFLAVVIETGAEGVVSRDKKAFESLEGVKRWELRELSELVYVYESGTLALAVGATATDGLLRLAAALLRVVAAAVFEALQVIAAIIVGLAEGTTEALSRVPSWAWVALGLGLLGVLIGALLHEGFRDWLAGGISKVTDFLRTVGKAVVGALTALAGAIHDLLAWIWEVVVPLALIAGKLTVVAMGALFRRIILLIEECNRVAVSGT